MSSAMWENITAIAVALLSLLAAAFRSRTARRDKRDSISRDLDLLSKLPSESRVRARLKSHVDSRIGALILDEERKRRDPVGVTLAVIFLMAGSWLTWFVWTNGGASVVPSPD